MATDEAAAPGSGRQPGATWLPVTVLSGFFRGDDGQRLGDVARLDTDGHSRRRVRLPAHAAPRRAASWSQAGAPAALADSFPAWDLLDTGAED